MGNKKLRQQNALITGGSHGIGRAIATAFAEEGANVFLTYNNTPVNEINELLKDLRTFGIQADAVQVNLSNTNALDTITQKAYEFAGPFTILVNNVGILTRTSFMDITEAQWDQVMTVNLKVPFMLSQVFAKKLIENSQPGSIINISSLSAHLARSQVAHYQSSKAALNMLSKSMAYELAPHQIRVNTLSPGLTETNANKDQRVSNSTVWNQRTQGIPLGRAGLPADYQGLAVLLASAESSWITGAEFIVDGGMSIV